MDPADSNRQPNGDLAVATIKDDPGISGDPTTTMTNGRPSTVHNNPLALTTDAEKGLPDPGGTVRVQLVHSQGISRARSSREKILLLAVALLSAVCLTLLYMLVPYYTRWKDHSNICLTEECVKTASSLLAAIDRTADPCEDFFQFACGTWNKRHIIPEDRSSITTFEVLADDLQVILKGLLDEAFNDQDNNATRKAKLFHRSCMNTTQIQIIGDEPLKEMLKSLGGWPVTQIDWEAPTWPLETLLGQLRGIYNLGIILEQWVGPDDKNSSANIIQFDQIHLGLPSRDYYLKASSQRELLAYLKLMVDVAELLGASRDYASVEMEKVLAFEVQLANASAPEADRHDTSSLYKKLTLQELQDLVPDIQWVNYLNTFLPTKVDETEPVVVYALSYLQKMGEIFASTNRTIIHNYALWKLILDLIPYIGEKYQVKHAEFRKVLLGISADRVRWAQCVELVNKRLGMAVGALFIRDNFNHESKKDAIEMIYNIREAFNELLIDNDWMDDETRKVAKQKANTMNERIGYPEILTDPVELSKEYELLEIDEQLYFQNILNTMKFEASKNLIKLRQPVNKERWTTEPAVVNAFYNPNRNDIVFPAGILQPLFYSKHFPKSLNYGGIGVVIGHEITHGFDDKGRQFDKDGNMKEWWNNKTIEAFTQRAQCIINQYSSYVLEEVGLHVNGKMTQGENIADNGGLKQAFRAYKKWVSKHGEEFQLPGINLSHDQLFFLNYAQIWCGTMRPEDALSKIRSSVHSPGPIRVLGPLSNSHDFAQAYSCPVGSRMNPVKKCSIW